MAVQEFTTNLRRTQMVGNVVMVLAAIWMLVMGSVMNVKSGGLLAGILYKALPIGLSFGVVLVLLKLI
jgi:hypothetical protein